MGAMRLSPAIGCAGLAVLMLVLGCQRKTAEDYLRAGDQAMQNTMLAQAETDYQEAVKLAPNDPRTHIALGNLYVFERKLGPAQLEFMKVLEFDPKNAASHAALGNVYASQSQLSLAEEQYRAAVALEAGQPAYRLELGQTLQKEGKLTEAEAELRTAAGLDPKNASAHLALADLLNAEPNRRTEAEAEYAEVRALNPHLLPAPAPTAEAAATPASVAAPSQPRVKDIRRKFLLTKNAAVYEAPDSTSRTLARVYRGKWVNVTGVSGKWLRVKLRNGTVGFIPAAAAE